MFSKFERLGFHTVEQVRVIDTLAQLLQQIEEPSSTHRRFVVEYIYMNVEGESQ